MAEATLFRNGYAAFTTSTASTTYQSENLTCRLRSRFIVRECTASAVPVCRPHGRRWTGVASANAARIRVQARTLREQRRSGGNALGNEACSSSTQEAAR